MKARDGGILITNRIASFGRNDCFKRMVTILIRQWSPDRRKRLNLLRLELTFVLVDAPDGQHFTVMPGMNTVTNPCWASSASSEQEQGQLIDWFVFILYFFALSLQEPPLYQERWGSNIPEPSTIMSR
jgi:hypothetical protein